MTSNEKISALRSAMSQHNLAAYIVNTADAHQSEYISDYFKERAWLTGFTGSAGTALLTQDTALLWADGRYFIQAEKQIADSEFKLMKMATPGYPRLEEWLLENLEAGERVGLNEETYSQKQFAELAEKLAKKGIELLALPSLIDDLWQDRPALPQGKIWEHKIEFTGLSAQEKIQKMREKMQKDDAQALMVTGLDDVAWLFNFRGSDVDNNPVSLAYALLTLDKAYLFIAPQKVDPLMQEYFARQGIEVKAYDSVANTLAQLDCSSIALEKSRISTKLYQALPSDIKVIDNATYVRDSKARLNETELKNQKASYKRDSAAITRYLFWLKREVSQQSINEWEAAEKLHEFRASGKNFIDESFTSISAYGSNAAMMHYAPTATQHSVLEPKSFYLIDSGGQYYDGTTDITRTIALGELTDEEKTDYTLTLKSHIALASAIFLKGRTGADLDCLAREPLWQAHMDYKCGTGHGVGYVLGVHEGPQGFSRQIKLDLGMVITIEPGVYKEGKHGIRLENDYVVAEDNENAGDTFYSFEVLSYVPFDREAIKKELLTPPELAWLNDYHKTCYKVLESFMESPEEKAQLKTACAEI